jgi:methionyl-tRNA synthetase
MRRVGELDALIQRTEPFKVVKVDKEKGVELIVATVHELAIIATLLKPFLPKTSAMILELVREHKMPETPLFGRLP